LKPPTDRGSHRDPFIHGRISLRRKMASKMYKQGLSPGFWNLSLLCYLALFNIIYTRMCIGAGRVKFCPPPPATHFLLFKA
jgi:hypothetical protein